MARTHAKPPVAEPVEAAAVAVEKPPAERRRIVNYRVTATMAGHDPAKTSPAKSRFVRASSPAKAIEQFKKEVTLPEGVYAEPVAQRTD